MVDNKLKSILTDNTSGSTEILENIIDYLHSNFEKVNYGLISILKENFKSFQSIENFLEQTEKMLCKSGTKAFQTFLLDYSAKTKLELNLLFKNSLPYLKNKTKFVTISNSRTIENIIISYYKVEENISVTIMESRPKYEGRILANKLAENGVKINLITEAMASESVEFCEAVLISADKILKSGDVINKTGSRNIAILAKYFNKPFFVIADKSKFSNDDIFERTRYNSNEIWELKNSNIKIYNYYFEKIDRELITKIVSN